jgi:hypothetical protein
MQAHERQWTDVADSLVAHDEPVLDDAAVLNRLEGVVPEDAAVTDAVESGIPRVLDPAVALVRGTLAGLFLWTLLLAAGFIALKAL